MSTFRLAISHGRKSGTLTPALSLRATESCSCVDLVWVGRDSVDPLRPDVFLCLDSVSPYRAADRCGDGAPRLQR